MRDYLEPGVIARLSNLKSPDDPMARHFNLPLVTGLSLATHHFPLLISCLISRPPIQTWHSNFPTRQSVPQGGINHKSAIQRPCHTAGRVSSWSATAPGAFRFRRTVGKLRIRPLRQPNSQVRKGSRPVDFDKRSLGTATYFRARCDLCYVGSFSVSNIAYRFNR